jgi:hypothetical protein
MSIESNINPTQESVINGNHLRIPAIIIAGTAVLAACGNGGDGYDTLSMGAQSGGTESTTPSDGTLAQPNDTVDSVEVLDGSDMAIWLDVEAGVYRCGGSRAPTDEHDVNFSPALLNQPENLDLLASKTDVLTDRIGEGALTVFAESVIPNAEADPVFTASQDRYTRLYAGAEVRELAEETVNAVPTRENFTCDDIDGDGVGDVSRFRDIRANETAEGENVTLLGFRVFEADYIKAAETAQAEGKSLDDLITEKFEVNVTYADGSISKETMYYVYFEDDNCGNQVFKPKTPETPGTTTTTSSSVPPDTNPNPSTTVPGRKDPTTTLAATENTTAPNPNAGGNNPNEAPVLGEPDDTPGGIDIIDDVPADSDNQGDYSEKDTEEPQQDDESQPTEDGEDLDDVIDDGATTGDTDINDGNDNDNNGAIGQNQPNNPFNR